MNNPNPQYQQWKLLILLLKEIADQKGINQGVICEKTGMLQSAVSRFFSLKFKPTIETFLLVAKAVNVNFFFEDKDGKADMNVVFENAMKALGRRPGSMPQN